MQDRINQVDEISCTARPDHTVGSISSFQARGDFVRLTPRSGRFRRNRFFGNVPHPDMPTRHQARSAAYSLHAPGAVAGLTTSNEP